jgi:hypothetical protein
LCFKNNKALKTHRTKMTSIFAENNATGTDSKQALCTVNTIVCIDNSGSTAGTRLETEKQSCISINSILHVTELIAWNNNAKIVGSINQISSTGCTDPCSILPLLRDKNYGCLVMYTDGVIDTVTMSRFSAQSQDNISDIPIIIIFAIDSFYVTIAEMNHVVNMSIPESFLAISNNVMIAIIAHGETSPRVLMSKGEFANYYEQVSLDDNLRISELPIADFAKFKEIKTMRLPQGQITIDGYTTPIILENVYNASNLDTSIIRGLMNRTVLPKLDLVKLRATLVLMLEKCSVNKDLIEVTQALAEEVTANGNSQLAQDLRKKYLAEKSNKTNNDKEKIDLINKFLIMINEYNRNKTSIVLSSNRANNAQEITEYDLTDIGICAIGDCNIMYDEAQLAITIRKEDFGPDKKYDPTADFFIDCPFALGKILGKMVLPGIYGYDIGTNFTRHPMTREDCHVIPLSYSPEVIIKHMAKAFTHCRAMSHLFRAFTAIIAHIIHNVEFFADRKEFFVDYLRKICEEYRTTDDLKGTIDSFAKKVTMTNAVQNVIDNYASLLLPRAPDARSIMEIADVILPNYNYPKATIEASLVVAKEFSEIFMNYKSNGRHAMVPLVFEFTEEGYFSHEYTNTQALIARIFLFDVSKEYSNLKYSDALSRALQHNKEFHNAYNNKPYNVTLFAYPEPVGPHFVKPGDYFAEEWSVATGLKDSLRCIYCGERFADKEEKLIHVKYATQYNGRNYFYNGDRIMSDVIASNPEARNKELVNLIYNALFKRYTYSAGFLMTKDATEHIRSRVEMLEVRKGISRS